MPSCFSSVLLLLSLQVFWSRFVLIGLVTVGSVINSAASTPADTLPTASRRVVKLGVRYGTATNRVAVPQLRYEWQVRPMWSLQVGSGYRRSYSNLGFYQRLRSSFWTTEVSALHYLGRPRARPLTGWYAGVGVGSLYRTIQDRNTITTLEDVRQAWGLESRLQLGVQAALNRRLALQCYVATTFTYFLITSDTGSGLLAPEIGFSLGYRH